MPHPRPRLPPLLLALAALVPACRGPDAPASTTSASAPPAATTTSSVAPRARLVRAYVAPTPCTCGARHGIAHVVDANGHDQPVSADRLAVEARVAPDGATVGVLLGEHVDEPMRDVDPPLLETELVLYRDGRLIRSLDVGPVNRAWAFLGNGAEVAFYTGGLHFAGWYARIDVATGALLDRLGDQDRDGREPAWVKALDPYEEPPQP
jgi:hypothetical protein